jgi:CBS domain-containing protein
MTMRGSAVATPGLLLDATRDFLRKHPPFDRMADEAFAFAIPRMELAYFAKDREVLAPTSGPATHLHIVHRGLVGSRVADPRADPEPTFGPGECFPVGALSAGGAPTKFYHAAQDTFCFVLPRADFLELRRRSPEFERFCAQAVTETLKQSLAQLSAHYGQRAAEQQSLGRPLAELVRRAPVACAGDAPLAEALERMNDARVRTVVVLGREGAPVGVFTLVDLLRRVVLKDRPLTTPLADVMSTPIVTLPANATAHDAMSVMAERAVRQVVVVEGARLVGVVNERDLFALTRVSMRHVIEGLHGATTQDALRSCADDIRRLTQSLLAQGVTAEPLTRTIASLNDAVSRRAIEMTLARHNLAEIDWCWLALGSEGRGEQTFATDQDNALVFRDNNQVAATRAALLAFAQDANEALAALGFPLCTGKVMAGNPEYCLTLAEWKERFMGWLVGPTPQALLGANIVFDFRALFGDSTLSDELRTWLFAYTRDNKAFLRLMAQNALEVGPPLGLIRAFVTDDEVPHRGTLDLKTRGTRLFVDAARVFALADGHADTGTAARLRAAGRALRVESRHVEATIDAFHFLQLLRLRLQDSAPGHGIANRLNPETLNEIDQRMLKEAFRQARKLQALLTQTYQL